ncbi:MAG: V-type ATP synthase subunit F [Actinomycetes bacterium]
MARIAVLGAGARVGGFALAGALVLVADDPEQARAAWDSLPEDIAVAVLTPKVAAALGDRIQTGPADLPLLAVMPE